MPETFYNVTIPNTSPTINYTPPVTNSSSGGWQSVCPTSVTSPSGENYWICDPDSAHTTTSNNVAFQLSFNGVAIYLFGNTTGDVAYDIDLDSAHFEAKPTPNLGLLYSATGLTPGMHSVGLTVRQPGSGSDPGRLTFNEAVVNAGTGLTGGEFERDVLDDGDPSITYYTPPGGNWTIENTYAQSIGPNGSTTFRNSYWTDATATVKFKGMGIEVYGACDTYSQYSAYSASIDGGAETSYGGTSNPSSNGGTIQQRTGSCLRYSQTGLGGSNDHTLVLRVKEGGRLAVDWVRVFSVSDSDPDGGDGGGGGGGGPRPPSSNSKIPILVGAIAGGIVLALALLAIFICVRRRRPASDKPDEPQYTHTPFTQVMTQTEPAPAPVRMPLPPAAPAPVVPPWPQPQTPAPWPQPRSPPPWPQPQSPAPSQATSNNLSIGSGIPGVAMSVASSRAPLLSPGLSSLSTHSRSASVTGSVPAMYTGNPSTPGPGASDSSRPAELARSTTVASRGSWAPRSSNLAAGGRPSAGSITGERYFEDSRSGAVSPAPTAPPAYDQIQGMYAGVEAEER